LFLGCGARRVAATRWAQDIDRTTGIDPQLALDDHLIPGFDLALDRDVLRIIE
jgi:hypothetical protein